MGFKGRCSGIMYNIEVSNKVEHGMTRSDE
jgi:hypothetical protein